MKQSKQILKRIIDLAMIVLLPLLMAEILTGQEIHEWLGTGMLALFLAHHFLNLGWWKSFLKGKYTPSRLAAAALAVYGIYAFIVQHMTDYLFLQTHFVMFDETKTAAVYFAETAAMMSLFAAAAYYINKLLCRKGGK